MKLLTALLVLLAIGLAAMVLIPLLGFALALIFPLLCFLIWVLPILIIASSDKTTGGEKLAWILAIIFLSWFAWVFYFLLAPIKQKPRYRPYLEHGSYRY